MLWGPTALPIRDESAAYVVRHGRGYSRFETTQHGVAVELLQFVPLDGAIKISRLRIRNMSGRTRHLTVAAYVEWVLGTSRGAAAPFVSTDIDGVTGAMFARNVWSDAPTRVAFVDLGGRQTSWTGDRREFLGRNGALASPAALARTGKLSDRTGAGLDPCGALQASLELREDAAIEIVWFLGEEATTLDAQALITHWRSADLDAALRSVRQYWNEVLGAVVVKTPDRSFDVMLNGGSIKHWLAGYGLAARSTRQAVHMDFAISYRTPWPWSWRCRRSLVNMFCAPPAGSSSRVTSSTGGCHAPAAGFAAESPMTAPGCVTA
jgi:cyclic beta-1,2-glucan synthetase